MKTTSEVNILLIDDDEVDVMTVQRACKRANIQSPLIVAGDGVEALEVLRSKSVTTPFIILLDLNMPRMSGLEFLSEVRSDDQLKDSVVFMLTTSNAEEDKIAAHKHNVAGYVVKQCAGQDFASLIELLEKYCEVVELPVHQHR